MPTALTIDVIQKHLDSDRRWRERRHPNITLNYELHRDTVITNRLTQRQSVNVPYMKKTLKTYLTQTNWPVDNLLLPQECLDDVLTASAMDVILDSNILLGLIKSKGREFFKLNVFVELLTYLRRTNSKLVIPAVVFEETLARYGDFIGQNIKDASDALESMQRNAITLWHDFDLPDKTKEVAGLKEILLKPGTGVDSLIYESYPKISLAEVARRGINRIRPANDKGEELRDVILWLSALEYAAGKSEIAFISPDGHFKKPDENVLHPQLVLDISERKVKIKYYNSIADFVRDNSLDKNSLEANTLLQFVTYPEVSFLAQDWLTGAMLNNETIREARVTNISFKSAEEYKVGDQASYIEAEYSLTLDLHTEQTLTSVSTFLNKPYQSFLGLGQYTDALPTYLTHQSFFEGLTPKGVTVFTAEPPKPISREFQADFVVQVSLRVTGGSRESLELDGISYVQPSAPPEQAHAAPVDK